VKSFEDLSLLAGAGRIAAGNKEQRRFRRVLFYASMFCRSKD
jgi:hypothetical protein